MSEEEADRGSKMDDPVTEMEPEIQKWTKEEVCQWLRTRVKVSPTVAHRFFEEEVLGEYIKFFDKGDILDLTKEHGTAVKITAHLELLKQGRTFQSPYPEYVERWSREQVYQWITEYAKIDGKHADQLLEGHVSGDCLVCFQKQDFLDLKVPSGPAVKILALLRDLKNNPEPVLNAVVNTSTSQEEAATSSQPRSRKKPHKKVQKASGAAIPTLQKTETPRRETPRRERTRRERTRRETPRTETPRTEATRREAPRTESPRREPPRRETPWTPTTAPLPARDPGPPDPVQHGTARSLLLGILDDLGKDDLKKFRFYLRELRMCSNDAIPQSRLEVKDTTDLADVMLQHYGPDTGLQAMLRVLPMIPRQDLKEELKQKTGQLKQQCCPKEGLMREANQGEKLKNLLTCGGNSLGFYNEYVVVVNKSAPQQLEYLQFLKTLKLFCVLDFDPNSAAIDGLCHSYGKSRVANKHDPALFVGETGDVIKKLNLYKQTSWVFCNGRQDLDSESCKVLDYKTWFRKACRDMEQLVSFVCKPEVLLQGRTLIIFLLLSPVLSEKDPIFDTYNAFYKNREGENIISICESQSTFEKWRLMVKGKCDSDISQQAVWELSLSEINGTVMALGPLDQSSDRLLPSSDSSFVVLTQKQKDLMTALDILCLNQCEKIHDEHSKGFHDFKIRVEEEFFRGGKVKWWNFYLCEKPKAKPFIKRDQYEKLKQMIKSQSEHSVDVCTLLNLFHHPGCGGTTLAMHVMWGLRRQFRCAVLKDNTLPHPEIAVQVRELMMLKNEKPSPVLLLVDDSKDTVNAQNLVTCIKIAIEESCLSRTVDTPSCHVIILNCVRSQSPQDLYRQHSTPSLCITSSITPKEQVEFEEKLLELRETHTKPENFYSFMIMKSNFDPKYVDGLVHNTLENFDFSTKKAKLFAFLSLLKTYVFDSEISISLSEEYLGLRIFKWNEDNVLDGMKPYSNFIIIDRDEEWGGYRFLRILHHSIAVACIEELERTYLVKVSDIIMSLLHCDLFFTTTPKIGKGNLERSIQRMLIQRQSRKDGDERDNFSTLIEKIHKQQGKGMIQDIFAKASSRLVQSASIPQALARYLYLNERDFMEALNWAEKAKKIKENSYTVNTIGQVYKNQLKSNIPSKKNGPPCSPEDLDTNMSSSKEAVTAFKRAQELANAEDELNEAPWEDDESEDNAAKSSYNYAGYVGLLEVAFMVFEMLSRLPFFEESDPLRKKYLSNFLKGSLPITSVHMDHNDVNNRYIQVIEAHKLFLLSLKPEVKQSFDILECYFTYIKANNSGKYHSKNHSTISDHFKKYVMLFCGSPGERQRERDCNPNLNVKMLVEEQRTVLEEMHADTFAGILQHLDKSADTMEEIVKCYAYIQENNQLTDQRQKTREKINFIWSSVILYLLKPKSTYVKKYTQLCRLLLETLQEVSLNYLFPDPYYLALLLFWPVSPQETEIRTYVTAIRKSSQKSLSILFQKRSTVSHFYLGKENELARLVSKPKLDECFTKLHRSDLAKLWLTGDIFREKEITSRLQRVTGLIEVGEVYAIYGKLKIPVRPAYIGATRRGLSTEKVSFYIGFAINGPLAYDIQFEN